MILPRGRRTMRAQQQTGCGYPLPPASFNLSAGGDAAPLHFRPVDGHHMVLGINPRIRRSQAAFSSSEKSSPPRRGLNNPCTLFLTAGPLQPPRQFRSILAALLCRLSRAPHLMRFSAISRSIRVRLIKSGDP